MAARRAARSLRPHRMKEGSKWPPQHPHRAPSRALYAPAASSTDADEVRGGRIWGVLRLSMGWVFLWAFLDKLLALGFATGRNPETGVVDRFGDAAWIYGGSPTDGFLKFGLHTKEPFTGLLRGPGRQLAHRVGLHALDGRHRHRAAARHRHPPGRRRRHRLDAAVLHRLGALAREQPVPRRPHRLRDRPGRHRRTSARAATSASAGAGSAWASSRSTRSSAERSGPRRSTSRLRAATRRGPSGGLVVVAVEDYGCASVDAPDGAGSGRARTVGACPHSSTPTDAQPGDRRRRDAPRRHHLRAGRAPRHRGGHDGDARGPCRRPARPPS